MAPPTGQLGPTIVTEGPNKGADIERARRFWLGVWLLAVPVVGGLSAIYPPTVAIGPAGWAVLAAEALVWVALLGALTRAAGARLFDLMYATSFTAAAFIAVVQWLAGGWATPYHQLFLALVVAAALIHTGRRAAVHTAWVVAMTLAPAAYGEVHGRIADVVVALGLWVFIAAFCSSVMVETRAQRATLLDNRDVAEDEARRDAVTGLENRRSFDETIEQALEHARDTGEALTLAVGDLDRFKAINDVHGHLAGDACLRAVADALSAAAREGDRVFRWGGDEFAVLIAGADRAAASAAAARLEAAVAASVRTPDGAPVTLTMGIAQDRGLRGADALVAEADEALLAGKRGRNLRAA